MKHRLIALAAGAALLAAALPAAAHGPTVRLTYGGPKPTQLTLSVGQTVHFQNAATTARSFTVVADDGSFESPTLGRAEGWHHTFEQPGEFSIYLKENTATRARILVGPPREEPGEDPHAGHDH